jgi:hypothetical protein
VSIRLKGTLLMTIGYVLSPLSWWNDAFVNIPISYCIGLLCGLISPRLFSPAMLGGYWLTNIAGLVLLHRGIVDAAGGQSGGGSGRGAGGRRVSRRYQLVESFAVSTLYTLLIILLMRYRIIKFPGKDGM